MAEIISGREIILTAAERDLLIANAGYRRGHVRLSMWAKGAQKRLYVRVGEKAINEAWFDLNKSDDFELLFGDFKAGAKVVALLAELATPADADTRPEFMDRSASEVAALFAEGVPFFAPEPSAPTPTPAPEPPKSGAELWAEMIAGQAERKATAEASAAPAPVATVEVAPAPAAPTVVALEAPSAEVVESLPAPVVEEPKMSLVNLTPHAISIRAASGAMLTVPPTAPAVRCAAPRSARPALDVEGDTIPVSLVEFGAVENLPAPQPGVAYVVSGLVLSQVADRADCFAPGEAIREAAYSPSELADVEAALELCEIDPALRTRVLSALKGAQGRVIGADGLSCTPAYGVTPPTPEPETVPAVSALETPAENVEPVHAPKAQSLIPYPEGFLEEFDHCLPAYPEGNPDAAWARLAKDGGPVYLPRIPDPIWEGKIEVSEGKYRVIWQGHPAEEWRRMPTRKTRTGRTTAAFSHGQDVWWIEGDENGRPKHLLTNSIQFGIEKQRQHGIWLQCWKLEFAMRLVADYPDRFRIEGQQLIRLDAPAPAPRKSPFQK